MSIDATPPPGLICNCRAPEAGTIEEYLEWIETHVVPVLGPIARPTPCKVHDEVTP